MPWGETALLSPQALAPRGRRCGSIKDTVDHKVDEPSDAINLKMLNNLPSSLSFAFSFLKETWPWILPTNSCCIPSHSSSFLALYLFVYTRNILPISRTGRPSAWFRLTMSTDYTYDEQVGLSYNSWLLKPPDWLAFFFPGPILPVLCVDAHWSCHTPSHL